jgi:Pentapeptide repeats (8 copies)
MVLLDGIVGVESMIEILSAEEVLSRYASGERNFSWKDLSGLDLHGADLRDTNLFGSNLSNTNLTDANLEGSNLGQANLRGALLRNANLRRVFLAGADLTGADVTGAEMMEAQIQPPPSAQPQAAPQRLSSAFATYTRVPPEKSVGLAGFLEWVFPGVGLLYCEEIARGVSVLFGTLLAQGAFFFLFIFTFVSEVDSGSIYSSDDLFGPLLLMRGVSLLILFIWLIVRIVWATRAARAFNERRLDTLRELRAQFRASVGAR